VIVVSVVLLLPIAFALVWSARQSQFERQTELRGEAMSVAVTASASLDEYLKRLDALASALVRHPAVFAFDRPATNRLFAALLVEQPLLTNIVLATGDGVVQAEGRGGQRTGGVILRPWPGQVVRTGQPQISDFGLDAISGRPTVTLAYPVFHDGPMAIGAIGFTVDLSQLQTVFASIPLPAGSVITVVDRDNRILVRSHEAAKYLGATLPPMDWAGLPRTARRTDVDGIPRLNGDAAMTRAPWMVTVGIPQTIVGDRLAPLRQRMFATALIAIAGVLLLSFWFVRQIALHLGRFRSAVRRIADGDLSPPAAGDVPNRELAELQDAFVAMAANLRETRTALDHQTEQDRKMNATLHSLQRQVVRQERLAAVGLLASGVAHEVNNPLQAIVGATELLERQTGLSEDALAEIQFVKAQSNRAREVIRSLSRFSSLQIGPPSPLDLRDVIKEMLQLRAADLEQMRLSVDVHATSDRNVYANVTEIEQVMINLLQNAQQAVEPEQLQSGSGRIEIRLFDSGPNVRLEVHDNGPGVGVDDEAKLFQPFFTTRPVGRGAGLGLSVSYGIIDSYGGEMGYFQNSWGGATFFFELPCLESSIESRLIRGQSIDDELIHDRPVVLRRPI
jgi:C4-dicarboxylate-specific signal transduction histidine kinase